MNWGRVLSVEIEIKREFEACSACYHRDEAGMVPTWIGFSNRKRQRILKMAADVDLARGL